MANPYKNNMQGNRIESNFLYRIMNIILLHFFIRKGEQDEKYTGLLRRNERKVSHSCRRRESGVHVVRTFYLIILSS